MNMINMHLGVPNGVAGAPNETALLELMERTNYTMIQENGQRKYGGPPPGWGSLPTPRGCEVFVGKIPRDCYEDELVPVFENIGKIYELRLMMDFSGANRGYCFVMYTVREDAKRAVKELNNYQIRKGRYLGVCLSVDNCRLFVGGIPKTKTKEEILIEMNKVTEGVVDVIVYPSATDKSKNRGFAFVEYESHRAAAMARRKLIPGRIQLWGHTIAIDWAEPEQEVDEDVMSKVKILYVRNLMLSTTEETLEKVFSMSAGRENAVERVKKLKDYAFIHFRERCHALQALRLLNGYNLEGTIIEVSLAKPVDKNEFVRLTRGLGSKYFLPQELNAQGQVQYPAVEAASPYFSMSRYYSAANSIASSRANPAVCSTSSGSMAHTSTIGCQLGVRGQGRGAARGAGGIQRQYGPPQLRRYRDLQSGCGMAGAGGNQFVYTPTMNTQEMMYQQLQFQQPTEFSDNNMIEAAPPSDGNISRENALVPSLYMESLATTLDHRLIRSQPAMPQYQASTAFMNKPQVTYTLPCHPALGSLFASPPTTPTPLAGPSKMMSPHLLGGTILTQLDQPDDMLASCHPANRHHLLI